MFCFIFSDFMIYFFIDGQGDFHGMHCFYFVTGFYHAFADGIMAEEGEGMFC